MTLGKSADQILGLADIETLIGCINQHVNNILCSELRLVLGTLDAHGKFVLIFVAGSQHSIMGHRPVLAPLKRLGAGFGCARAAL